jgi:GTP diphosphokinase / guanosine-3',5'-bis(diphosphate) 3'-diphosphatase
LLEVASLVAQATGAKDPNLIIAALLHDAIEDQEISREEIARRFVSGVATLVQEVTDDKSLPSTERKRLQVEQAKKIAARQNSQAWGQNQQSQIDCNRPA